MEETMYSAREAVEMATKAFVNGSVLGAVEGAVCTVVTMALIGGIAIAAEKIKERVQKKKLEKTVDDFKEFVAEMD